MPVRYTNIDGTTPDKGPADLLKWQVGDRLLGRRRRHGPPFATPRRANDGARVRAPEASLTWVGHATFAMRLAGKLVLTDPVLGDRIQGFVRRLSPPGLALADLGEVDVIKARRYFGLVFEADRDFADVKERLRTLGR